MKKTSLIIIGLVLAVFLSGHYFIFKIAQVSHQKQFRSLIQKDLKQLKKIDISPSELYTDSKTIKWLDNNKEVMIGDVMYDVVFTKNSGKTVTLFVYNDTEEKTMLDKYNQLANSLFNDSDSSKPDVVKDFLSLKYLNNTPFEFTASNTFLSITSTDFQSDLATVFLSQETPPPNKLS